MESDPNISSHPSNGFILLLVLRMRGDVTGFELTPQEKILFRENVDHVLMCPECLLKVSSFTEDSADGLKDT